MVEVWYIDEEGDVGVFTYANSVILEDKPRFMYKKDLIEKKGIFYEKILREVIMPTDINPEVAETKEEELLVRAHIIKKLPFIVQYNTRNEKNFRGISDIEIVSDMQESIKKLITIEEEKQIRGTFKIITKKGSGLKDKITSAAGQIMETANPTNDVVVVDMKTPDQGVLNLYGLYYQVARSTLGITSAFKGEIDNKELSGRAIEQLSMNTAGRMATKNEEKEIAFSKLYAMIFEFYLAFCDDVVPFKYDKDNEPQYGYFDKSKLAKKDEAGEWYYPEFGTAVTVDKGISRDRRFLLDFLNTAGDRIDNVAYWSLADAISVPGANYIKERAIEQEKAQQDRARQEIEARNQKSNSPLQGGNPANQPANSAGPNPAVPSVNYNQKPV